jgi:hypothetical protein
MYTAKKSEVIKTVMLEIGSSLLEASIDGLKRGFKQQLDL